MAFCTRCGRPLAEHAQFCTACGTPLAAASAGIAQPQPPLLRGRWHSPILALLCGLLIPGGGQAYNGRPFWAFFVLVTSVLILPYLLGVFLAYRGASQIATEGGRIVPGGLGWVCIHAWLTLDLVVLALIVLTVMGVLR